MLGWFLGLFVFAAHADQGELIDDVSEEVVVYGDGFNRWDGTRWHIEQQIVLPLPIRMMAENNLEITVRTVRTDAVIACEKTFKRGRRHEVACDIEDVAIQALSREGSRTRYEKGLVNERDRKQLARIAENGQIIVDEWVGALQGKPFSLIVTKDGRIERVEFDYEMDGSLTPRVREIRDMQRQLISRMFAGFHLGLPKGSGVTNGRQWVEYNSLLVSFPTSTGSPGSSQIVHQLNEYKGQMVLQSVGNGLISLQPLFEEEMENFMGMTVDVNGVSIFDPKQGYIIERVWNVLGRPTSDASFQFSFGDVGYAHSGRLQMLREEQKPTLGESHVRGTAEGIEGLPVWVPFD